MIVNLPNVDNNGKIDVIEMQVEEIMKDIITKMNEMKSNGYDPEHLVIWEGYLGALGAYNQRYGIHSDPFVHPKPIEMILGLNIIITKKEYIAEVY